MSTASNDDPLGATIQSMTGSGRALVQDGPIRIEVDAHSVNNRFLKTSVRTSGGLRRMDANVSATTKARFQRGHITIAIRLERDAATETASRIDAAAFERGAKQLDALAKASGIASVTPRDVLAIPGVIIEHRDAPDEAMLDKLIATALEQALASLEASRTSEGAHLASELAMLFGEVESLRTELVAVADRLPAAVQAKLVDRLKDLLNGTNAEVEPSHLAREVAMLADRADIREELTRLASHGKQARELLGKGGGVGRALEFLLQEFHREINTIGSKAADLNVTNSVLAMKSVLERIREQVQNVE